MALKATKIILEKTKSIGQAFWKLDYQLNLLDVCCNVCFWWLYHANVNIITIQYIYIHHVMSNIPFADAGPNKNKERDEMRGHPTTRWLTLNVFSHCHEVLFSSVHTCKHYVKHTPKVSQNHKIIAVNAGPSNVANAKPQSWKCSWTKWWQIWGLASYHMYHFITIIGQS